MFVFFFFFNDTATTEIYTLSLHDALPISRLPARGRALSQRARRDSAADPEGPRQGVGLVAVNREKWGRDRRPAGATRSEEHTSELQSRPYLVCRLLLEKKKKDSFYTVFVL